MRIDQAKTDLEAHQKAFHEFVKEPNTLARNLVLAEHRTEIKRLEKFIAKSTPPVRVAQVQAPRTAKQVPVL